MPAQPVDRPGAFGDQVLAMVDQQLDLPGRLVMTGGGSVWFAQGGPGDRQGVDRVGRGGQESVAGQSEGGHRSVLLFATSSQMSA
jgi:hypothetical protein